MKMTMPPGAHGALSRLAEGVLWMTVGFQVPMTYRCSRALIGSRRALYFQARDNTRTDKGVMPTVEVVIEPDNVAEEKDICECEVLVEPAEGAGNLTFKVILARHDLWRGVEKRLLCKRD